MFRKSRSSLTVVDRRTIIISGREIPYVVKRSQRARYARLEVGRETGLAVVVPRRYKLERVPDLLMEKSAWILSKLAGVAATEPGSVGRRLESGDSVPYLGRSLDLVVRQDSRRSATVRLERDKLVVSLGPSSRDTEVAVERWYRAQARRVIGAKAEELSAHLGITYERLTIRGQRTRWGSCSQKGNISFNWKLMLAPEPVIDYVVVHETAHLKELNHSKRFWELVAESCPRWRQHRKWLKEHETELTGTFSA